MGIRFTAVQNWYLEGKFTCMDPTKKKKKKNKTNRRDSDETTAHLFKTEIQIPHKRLIHFSVCSGTSATVANGGS